MSDLQERRAGVYTVGVALKKEKARKHIRDELVACALANGIRLVLIDEFVPLEEQGPFDAILQKIRRPEFEAELEKYAKRHPQVILCDPPKKTHLLRNRNSMLNIIPRDGFILQEAPEIINSARNNMKGKADVVCSVPSHSVLAESATFDDALLMMKEHNLRYPIIAKSLWADGRPGSHDIAVVWTDTGLQRLIYPEDATQLKPPVLLEQYVDHGNCLFKVYVLGDQKVMVTRPSLHLETEDHESRAADADISRSGSPPAPTAEEIASLRVPPPDIEYISRVSAYPRSRSWGKEDLAPKGHGVPTPPDWVWRGIATYVQDTLGLTLFNFDIIVPLHPPTGMRALVQTNPSMIERGLIHLIDINYYPGVEKLPNSEKIIVQFLNGLRQRN